MESTNNQTNMSKSEYYIACLKAAAVGDPEHFLTGILLSLTPEIIEQSYNRSNYRNIETSHFLREAIWNFYNDFDMDRMKTYVDEATSMESCCRAVMTPVIWARFQEQYTPYREGASTRRRERIAARDRVIAQGRHDAALKRQAKVEELMFKMGGGDMEEGRKRFQQKAVIDKAVKQKKEYTNLSDTAIDEFATWLKTPEGQGYFTAPSNGSRAVFTRAKSTGTLLSTTNLRSDSKGMLNLLHELSTAPGANSLNIVARFKWNPSNAYDAPNCEIVTRDHGTLALNARDRQLQGSTSGVLGTNRSYLGVSHLVTAMTS